MTIASSRVGLTLPGRLAGRQVQFMDPIEQTRSQPAQAAGDLRQGMHLSH
jgi:hypothetical protein